MAFNIRSLASEYEIEILEKYTTQLYEAIDAFDIMKLEQMLQNFKEIEKSLIE